VYSGAFAPPRACAEPRSRAEADNKGVSATMFSSSKQTNRRNPGRFGISLAPFDSSFARLAGAARSIEQPSARVLRRAQSRFHRCKIFLPQRPLQALRRPRQRAKRANQCK
jgi:hypothetical protein